MVPRLYIAPERLAGANVELEADERHYLGQVLRRRVGEPVEVFDGLGRRYRATLGSIDRRSGRLEDLLPAGETTPPTPAITLVQSLATGDKTDWVIEKATEAGAAAIVLLAAERSTARAHDDRLARKRLHWSRIASAACAQCRRDHLPRIVYADGLSAALPGDGGPVLIADPQAALSLPAWARAQARAPATLTLLVGPESGFSAHEHAQALAAGAVPVGLGPRVWRTETAGLAAVVLIQSVLGDLQ